MVNDPIFDELLLKLGNCKRHLLRPVRMALGDEQFEAFRLILLEELGRDGFEKDLENAFLDKKRNETSRNIHAGKEVSE